MAARWGVRCDVRSMDKALCLGHEPPRDEAEQPEKRNARCRPCAAPLAWCPGHECSKCRQVKIEATWHDSDTGLCCGSCFEVVERVERGLRGTPGLRERLGWPRI